MIDVRCPKCQKLIGRSDGQGAVEIECPRCKLLVRAAPTFTVEIVPHETKPTGSFRVLGDTENRVVKPSNTK